MKKIILLFFTTCIILILSCCYNRKGGCWEPPQFSSTTLNFDAKGGSGVISSPNVGWWYVGDIVVDTCGYQHYQGGQTGEGVCRLTAYRDTVYKPDDYHHQYPFPRLLKVEGTWFSMGIERDVNLNPLRLLFSVQPNETGKSRKVQVFTGAACSETILTITQSAEYRQP